MPIHITARDGRCFFEPQFLSEQEGIPYYENLKGLSKLIFGEAFEIKSSDGKIYYINRRDLEDWLANYTHVEKNHFALKLSLESVVKQEKSAYWTKVGDHLRRYENGEKAVKAYKSALREDRLNVKALIGRAMSHRLMGDYINAIADCSKAIEIQQDYSYAWACRGDCYRMLEQCQAAVSDLEKALNLNASNDYALASLADCYLQQGDPENALAKFKAALEINPRNFFAKTGLGDTYLFKAELLTIEEQYEKARAELHKFLSLELPDNSAANACLQKIYKARGKHWIDLLDLDKAIRDFSDALKIDPFDDEVLMLRAGCYEGEGMLEECIQDYVKALKINPNNGAARTHFGNFLKEEGSLMRQLGKYVEAIDLFNEFVKFDVSDPDIWIQRGECLCELKKYQDAHQNYQDALKANPKNGNLFLLRAECLFYLQKFHDARIDCFRYLKDDRRNSYALFLIGAAYLLEQNYQKAELFFTRAIAVGSQTVLAYRQRAKALVEMKKFKEALDDCETALKVDQNDSVALEMREKIMQQNSWSLQNLLQNFKFW